MKKLLIVDACVRGEASRTRRLAARLIAAATRPDTEPETVRLPLPGLEPLDAEALDRRNRLIAEGAFDHPELALARGFRDADAVILAAPFWDLSFPSVLRVYLERLCVTNLTFHYEADGACVGDCRAQRLVYVTTRGGLTGPDASPDLAQPYLRALAQMLGISRFDCLSAEGLDLVGADAEALLAAAETEADALGAAFWA